jgi:hypothetical protein
MCTSADLAALALRIVAPDRADIAVVHGPDGRLCLASSKTAPTIDIDTGRLRARILRAHSDAVHAALHAADAEQTTLSAAHTTTLSDGFVDVAAATRGGVVGIDALCLESTPAVALGHVFGVRERAALGASLAEPPGQLRHWVRKEAVVKALGIGIHGFLAHVELVPAAGRCGQWQMVVGGDALAGALWTIRERQLPDTAVLVTTAVLPSAHAAPRTAVVICRRPSADEPCSHQVWRDE